MNTPISGSIEYLKEIFLGEALSTDAIDKIGRVIASLEELNQGMVKLDSPEALIPLVVQLVEGYARDTKVRVKTINVEWIPEGVTKVEVQALVPESELLLVTQGKEH